MQHDRIHIPLQSPVRSLCWLGDDLVDWVGGGVVIGLDGRLFDPQVCWAYRFDAAVQSPLGRCAVVYERLGPKGLVISNGKPGRELNRSFYYADAFEYPVVLFEHADGRTLVAHCPEEYNRIEIEDALTGERLTRSADRKPADFFHSRLAVSPGGTRLLSAGWIWHPEDSVSTWSIDDALADSRTLDPIGPPDDMGRWPLSSAVFVDEDRILVSSNPDEDDYSYVEYPSFRPGSLGVFNLRTNAFESVTRAEETVGNMLWLGDGLVVGFYQTPKVFNVATGRIVYRWPDIASGSQSSSIIHHLGRQPVTACDHKRRRFAIASDSGIDIIQL